MCGSSPHETRRPRFLSLRLPRHPHPLAPPKAAVSPASGYTPLKEPPFGVWTAWLGVRPVTDFQEVVRKRAVHIELLLWPAERAAYMLVALGLSSHCE